MKKWILPGLILLLFACNGDEEKADDLLRKGNHFMEKSNYSSALTCFRDALRFDMSPELKSKVCRNLTVVFLYQEQLDSARHYSKLGMNALPESSYYHYINMAEYELLNDEIGKAIGTFEKAREKDPAQMEVYNNLSLIYSGAYGDQYVDLNKALTNAQKAHDLVSNRVNREQLASVYFQLENYPEASKMFRTLMEENPEVKMYQFYLGQALYFDGQENEGMDLMQDAASRDAECSRLFDAITQ